jgi:F-type H+/Na+-transporting ATPase subunit alpha
MSSASTFQAYIEAGNATGEVISTDRFLVGVSGLTGVALHAKVLFETGQYGLVSRIQSGSVTVLNLESEETVLGGLVVACSNVYEVPVSERYIGRVINPLGQPIDGKGALHATETWPLYKRAPDMIDRQELHDRLPTGVTAVDSFFPVVQGQRIAVIGDAKSGKTTFLLQLGANQKESGRIMVYVLIGKRRVEIEHFLTELTNSGALA